MANDLRAGAPREPGRGFCVEDFLAWREENREHDRRKKTKAERDEVKEPSLAQRRMAVQIAKDELAIRRAEFRFAQERGELVPISQQQRDAAEVFQLIKQELLAMPEILSRDLADDKKAHGRRQAENKIRLLLKRLAGLLA